jgi:hypothetical protein
VAALLFLALPSSAATPFHLTLEANAAAPFPFLGKFGTVEVHVYPAGVRAESLWLDAFSRNGAREVTVLNPLQRMYTEMPLADIAPTVGKLSGHTVPSPDVLPLRGPVAGTVHGIAAQRWRIEYGPQAWIDVWTTQALGDAPQYRAIVQQFLRGVSPPTANTAAKIPGVPLYVELNFSHYRKLPILTVKSLAFDAEGEEDALHVGALYIHAPFNGVWK